MIYAGSLPQASPDYQRPLALFANSVFVIVFNSSLFLALQYKNGQKVGLLDPTSTRRVCGWGFIEGEPSKGVYRDSILPHDVVSVKVAETIDLEVLLPSMLLLLELSG